MNRRTLIRNLLMLPVALTAGQLLPAPNGAALFGENDRAARMERAKRWLEATRKETERVTKSYTGTLRRSYQERQEEAERVFTQEMDRLCAEEGNTVTQGAK